MCGINNPILFIITVLSDAVSGCSIASASINNSWVDYAKGSLKSGLSAD